MKNFRYFGVLLFLFLGVLGVQAQGRAPETPDPYELRLKNRTFTPGQSLMMDGRTLDQSGSSHVLLQFDKLPSPEALEREGIKPLNYVSATTIAAAVDPGVNLEKVSGLRWIGQLAAQDKISEFAGNALNGLQEDTLVVEAYSDVSAEALQTMVKKNGGVYSAHPSLPGYIGLVTGTPAVFDRLAVENDIAWISPASAALRKLEPVYFCPGALTPYGPVANYVLHDDGWDGPGQGSAALTYHFENGTADISGSNEDGAVVAGLTEWGNYADITFSETASVGLNDSVDIKWATGDHGDGYPFDGPSGVLAHTFYPSPPNSEPIAGNMHFDDAESWSLTSDFHLFTVALHEAGHALGIAHSDNPNAVMYAYYGGPVNGLHSDDIAAIQAIYSSSGAEKLLAVNFSGTGSGTVTSSPPGINCQANCSHSFANGTVVTLSATADGGSSFSGWSGSGCSGTGSCVVTMSQQRNVTATFLSTLPADILLVDDDDNAPDVQSYYTQALDALGLNYHIWDTGNSDGEPTAVNLAAYEAVIWFTGDEYGGFAGPGSAAETALGSWLDGGKCLLISSQDYYYDRGLTPFMTNYLGVSSIENDTASPASVSGSGAVFNGLGPYTLSFPFQDYADIVTPGGSAAASFIADGSTNVAVLKDNGTYRTTYLGFPLAALPTNNDRSAVLNRFITWCAYDTGTIAALDDIFWYAAGPNADYLARSNGNGTFNFVAKPIGGTFTPLVGNFAGSGATDIFWYAPGAPADYLWTATGGGNFTEAAISVSGTYQTLLGDFDNNGFTDIFWYAPGPNSDWLALSSGNGIFDFTLKPVGGTYTPLVGNFAGSAADDIFWYAPGSPPDYLWTAAGGGGFTESALNVSGSYQPLLGDFDNNGYTDFFWYAPGLNADWLALANGSGGFTYTPKPVGGTYTALVGNFAGSAADDIFWYAPGSPLDYLWTAVSSSSFSESALNVAGTYDPILGDYNRDGYTDVFWYVAGSGADWVALSNGNGTFAYTAQTIGGTYTPFVGDFDGSSAALQAAESIDKERVPKGAGIGH